MPIKTSPAKWDDDVADHDRVVFGTGLAGGGDGHVVMVDAKADGALMWNHSLGAPVLASPAVEGDTVFAGSDGGDFVALSAFTGDLLWSVSVDAKIRSDPQVFGPVEDAASRPRYVVVFASEVGGVHAYYVDTTVVGSTAGESAWAAPGNVGGDTECDLLYDANTTSLYIGTEGGALVAIDALTGETRFTANTGNRIRSRPAIADVFNHTVRTNCSDPCPPRFFGRYVVAVNFNGVSAARRVRCNTPRLTVIRSLSRCRTPTGKSLRTTPTRRSRSGRSSSRASRTARSPSRSGSPTRRWCTWPRATLPTARPAPCAPTTCCWAPRCGPWSCSPPRSPPACPWRTQRCSSPARPA